MKQDLGMSSRLRDTVVSDQKYRQVPARRPRPGWRGSEAAVSKKLANETFAFGWRRAMTGIPNKSDGRNNRAMK